MTALIDLDSILYQSVYRIVSLSDIRDALEKYGKESARQWLYDEVLHEGVNRCENRLLQIQNYLQDIMIEEIDNIELFITTCDNSFRKKISSTYKANRKQNDYVWLLRGYYQMTKNAFFSDTLEADDLISIRANELGKGNYVVVSMDKDLKQIGGYFWSYYQQNFKDKNGDIVFDDLGFGVQTPIKEYKQKEVEYISEEKANYLFWCQMLIGDPSDNIKGLNRVGIKTAEKILSKSKCLWFTVAREYIKKDQKDDWKINYQLLKLKTKINN